VLQPPEPLLSDTKVPSVLPRKSPDLDGRRSNRFVALFDDDRCRADN
jgi:hypothetical protein